MQEFQILRYIKKWMVWIIAICIVLTIGVYIFLSTQQTYVASAVIRYEWEQAEEGLTPSGSELDVNEIKSSAIMSKVLENLSLGEQSYSVDELISRITITEIADEDKEAAKEAAIENGEEYVYEPTDYIVAFEAKHDEGEKFARQVLDEVLDVYFAEFSETYINNGATVNALHDLDSSNYDYIEMLEIIESNLGDTIETLTDRASNDAYYRATSTGKTFGDLAGEFYYIQSVKMSQIYASILENQITKDKDLLISNYTERINNYHISNTSEQEKIQDVMTLIDAYVEKMRESGNTNITYEYILDDIYEKNLVDTYGEVIGEGDQTVTYDKLIYSWRDHNENKEVALVDAAYCNYIIGVFSECKGADGGACSVSGHTCTELNSADYSQKKAEVEADISELLASLEDVYTQVELTNTEYNEYLGANNISVLSTVAVDASFNVWLYTAIAAVFFLVICCGGVILVGRLDDIIQYVFYTDRLTGMKNRTYFDSYLHSNGKKILDKGTALTTIDICNQMDINMEYGRDAGDQIIRFFADQLKNEFGKMDAILVYNGKAQFIVVVQKTDRKDMEYILEHFRLCIDKRELLKECRISYEIGLAETETCDVYSIRGLLSKAYVTQEKFFSE